MAEIIDINAQINAEALAKMISELSPESRIVVINQLNASLLTCKAMEQIMKKEAAGQ